MKAGEIVVLDSNILLMSASRKSRYNPIFQALIDPGAEVD